MVELNPGPFLLQGKRANHHAARNYKQYSDIFFKKKKLLYVNSVLYLKKSCQISLMLPKHFY